MTRIDPTMIILNASTYNKFHVEDQQIKRGENPDQRDASKKFVELVDLVATAFEEASKNKIQLPKKAIEGAYQHVEELYLHIQETNEPRLQQLKAFAQIREGGKSKIQQAMDKLEKAYDNFQKGS